MRCACSSLSGRVAVAVAKCISGPEADCQASVDDMDLSNLHIDESWQKALHFDDEREWRTDRDAGRDLRRDEAAQNWRGNRQDRDRNDDRLTLDRDAVDIGNERNRDEADLFSSRDVDVSLGERDVDVVDLTGRLRAHEIIDAEAVDAKGNGVPGDGAIHVLSLSRAKSA